MQSKTKHKKSKFTRQDYEQLVFLCGILVGTQHANPEKITQLLERLQSLLASVEK